MEPLSKGVVLGDLLNRNTLHIDAHGAEERVCATGREGNIVAAGSAAVLQLELKGQVRRKSVNETAGLGSVKSNRHLRAVVYSGGAGLALKTTSVCGGSHRLLKAEVDLAGDGSCSGSRFRHFCK